MFAEIFAGLGLFFIGIKLISHNLKQMTGYRMRSFMMGLTKSTPSSILCGTFLGTVAQSTSAVTFIVASMVSAGLLTIKRAIPLINWANVGNSTLVFISALNIRFFVCYLVGMVGVAYLFGMDKSRRWRHLVATMLGVGLLFLGLMEIKEGSRLLQEVGWFNDLVLFSERSSLLSLVIGALLAILAQSSTTVSVVAIAMAYGGLFTESQIILLIYGANLGSGINFIFLSAPLKGSLRQLGYLQVICKLIGAAIFIPLFYIEHWFRIPLIETMILAIPGSLAFQMAVLFALYQLVSALILTVLAKPLERWLQRLSPPTVEENLARFHYLYDQAMSDPPTALDLVEKEQGRILALYPEYVDNVRAETVGYRPLESLHRASAQVLREIDRFFAGLGGENISGEVLDRLLVLQNRNALLGALDETLYDLTELIGTVAPQSRLKPICSNMAESLHFLLLTTAEAVESEGKEDRLLLLQMTEDRGDLMEELRKSFFRAESGLSYAEQNLLYSVTSRFERIVWIIRRMARQPAR